MDAVFFCASLVYLKFSGSCPLEKLYASLEKMRGEECLRHVEYVSADREKYSSNLSLPTRGAAQRSVAAQKTASAVRHSPKSTVPTPRTTSAKSPGNTTVVSSIFIRTSDGREFPKTGMEFSVLENSRWKRERP